MTVPVRQRLFVVPRDDVARSFDFAVEMYERKAATIKNFNDNVRDRAQYIANHILGKAAEIAFQGFLRTRYGIRTDIDWSIRDDQLDTDDGNEFSLYVVEGLEFPAAAKVDVKASNATAQWLLIEESKIFPQSANRMPTDFYIGATWSNSESTPNFVTSPCGVLGREMVIVTRGFAHRRDLLNQTELQGWIEFKKGERLLRAAQISFLRQNHHIADPKASFEAFVRDVEALKLEPSVDRIGPKLVNSRNVGLPYCWLRNSAKEWDRLIARLVGRVCHAIQP